MGIGASGHPLSPQKITGRGRRPLKKLSRLGFLHVGFPSAMGSTAQVVPFSVIMAWAVDRAVSRIGYVRRPRLADEIHGFRVLELQDIVMSKKAPPKGSPKTKHCHVGFIVT